MFYPSVLFFSLFALLVTAELNVFESRSYVCRKGPSGVVDCRISFDGNEEWDAINDNGCYQEAEPQSQSIIEWCPLQCPDSPKAYITENVNNEVSGCDSESFGVFRRKNDWFLWRAEPCDEQEAVFRVVCTRPETGKTLPEVSMEKMTKPEEEAPVSDTVQVESNNDVDEHLPEAVDTILRAMFPSYRKAKQ